jgi:FkbM family methyltransferase
MVDSPENRSEPLPEFAADYNRLAKLREYDFAPASILDIGASSGVWSGTCSMIFPEAEYFLIEPQIYPKEYAPVFGIKRRWIRQAVGSREEAIELLVPEMAEQSHYNAHVLTPPVGSLRASAPTRKIMVSQTTVDHLLESGEIRPPQLVKLDVQGYELEVMRGASRLWESAKVFFVETSLYRYWEKAPLLSEVVGFFAQYGFQFYDFATENRMGPGLLSQLDIIFISEKCQMARVMDESRLKRPLWV